MVIRNFMRHAKISYPFLIANAKFFNASMALYLYAKIERGNRTGNRICVPVAFNLEEAAMLLNIKPRTMYAAYDECLQQKWFEEITRECYWVEVIVKD